MTVIFDIENKQIAKRIPLHKINCRQYEAFPRSDIHKMISVGSAP